MLWFAFILLSLSYWKQQGQRRLHYECSCDLLSFYYLCRTGNNSTSRHILSNFVVICFHFTIFVVLETTVVWRGRAYATLWFAFILLSLSYWKQRASSLPSPSCSCDLLSFYYLCRTGNNTNMVALSVKAVVICFHFTIFVVLETTYSIYFARQTQLWFAFILLSLSYWKQLTHRLWHTDHGCDLLSFYYLCRTGNNHATRVWFHHWVVICFHFTIFVVLETTRYQTIFSFAELWFAFILLSLSYWKQLSHEGVNSPSCCDLLSFYYLCRTGNNRLALWLTLNVVVICFHFTIFVVLETTFPQRTISHIKLWFAFILLSLSYWKQL